ncbi:BTB/POZ domain [Trinorchestia longiramus]|nr:BTB/POZ domain [Trinorchestia longiramus]
MAVNGCDSPSEQHYSLKWNDYSVKLVTAFQSLREEEDFVDVTVACDGRQYSAHRMVLSACSPYFRTMLKANPCKHPIVILKDVGCAELERLLEFMYNGEVNIAQDQLAAFLRTAESLKIRGLAGGGAPAAFEEHAHKMRFGGTVFDTQHPHQQHCADLDPTGSSGGISSHPLPKKRKIMLADDHSCSNSRDSGGGSRAATERDTQLTTGSDVSLMPLKSEPADSELLNDASVPFANSAGGDTAQDHASMAGLYSLGSEHNGGDSHMDCSTAPASSSDAVAGCEALNLSVRSHQRSSSPPPPPHHHLHHLPSYSTAHHSEEGLQHQEYPHHHHQQRHHSAPGVVRCISIPEEFHHQRHHSSRFTSACDEESLQQPGRDTDEACQQYRSHSIGPRLTDVHEEVVTYSPSVVNTSPTRNGHRTVLPPPSPIPSDGLLYRVKLEYPPPKQERTDLDEDSMDLGGGGDPQSLETVAGDLPLHGASDLHLADSGSSAGHEYENSAALSAISTILSAEQRSSRAGDDCANLKVSVLHRGNSLPNGDMDDECQSVSRRNLSAVSSSRPPNSCSLGVSPRAHLSASSTSVVVSSGGGSTGSSGSTKVYPCSECAKVFRHPMSLHHHRHVHRGTYTCQSCTKVFSRRWDLHRHLHRSKLGCRRPSNGTTTTSSYSGCSQSINSISTTSSVSVSNSAGYSCNNTSTSTSQDCLVLSPDYDASLTSSTASNPSNNLQCSPPYAVSSGKSAGTYKLVSSTSHRPKITIACDLISPPSTRDHARGSCVSLTNGGELYATSRSSNHSTSNCKSSLPPPSCEASPPSCDMSSEVHASQASPPQGGSGCPLSSFPPSRL